MVKRLLKESCLPTGLGMFGMSFIETKLFKERSLREETPLHANKVKTSRGTMNAEETTGSGHWFLKGSGFQTGVEKDQGESLEATV